MPTVNSEDKMSSDNLCEVIERKINIPLFPLLLSRRIFKFASGSVNLKQLIQFRLSYFQIPSLNGLFQPSPRQKITAILADGLV